MNSNSKKQGSPAIAWRGHDGRFRVISYPYDKTRMSVQSKAPAGATVVKDAKAAFDVAAGLHGKAPSKHLVAQMKADRIQEAKSMGVSMGSTPAVSAEPISISRKVPRISQ